MIVCVCNRLNDKVCKATAQSGQCRNVGCMYRLHGKEVQCGKCVPTMLKLLKEHSPKVVGQS